MRTCLNIKILCVILLCTSQIWTAAAEESRLLGVCEPERDEVSCKIYSSLEGNRYIQINGVGFKDTAQDHQPLVKNSDGSTGYITAPSISRDDNFLSNIAKGKLTYLLPSLEDLLGSSMTDTSVFEGILSVKGSSYLLE